MQSTVPWNGVYFNVASNAKADLEGSDITVYRKLDKVPFYMKADDGSCVGRPTRAPTTRAPNNAPTKAPTLKFSEGREVKVTWQDQFTICADPSDESNHVRMAPNCEEKQKAFELIGCEAGACKLSMYASEREYHTCLERRGSDGAYQMKECSRVDTRFKPVTCKDDDGSAYKRNPKDRYAVLDTKDDYTLQPHGDTDIWVQGKVKMNENGSCDSQSYRMKFVYL